MAITPPTPPPRPEVEDMAITPPTPPPRLQAEMRGIENRNIRALEEDERNRVIQRDEEDETRPVVRRCWHHEDSCKTCLWCRMQCLRVDHADFVSLQKEKFEEIVLIRKDSGKTRKCFGSGALRIPVFDRHGAMWEYHRVRNELRLLHAA